MIRVARRRRWWQIAAVLVLCARWAAAQPPTQDSFAAGTAAFAQGDYARALALFEAARQRGPDTPSIEYNLGVCQYRLADYTAAEATFGRLARQFPEFRALAEYNRALALLALGRREEAIAAFGVARADGDDRLAALARDALAEVGSSENPLPPARWRGYFGLSLGHDDNVALVDELSLPANVSADSPFAEGLAYVSRGFDGLVPVRIELSGYTVRYADDHAFDQDSLSVGAAFQWSAGKLWSLEAGPYLARSSLDGDGFEKTFGAQVRAARGLRDGFAFDVRFLYDDIGSLASRYDFVAGHRERLRFTLERRNAGRRLRAAYEIESQDRSDPGVSPDRNRILFAFGQPLRGRWSIDGTFSYRASRYDALAVQRTEKLVEFSVMSRRELKAGWFFDADYRWDDNSSNVAQFSYTSRRIGAGISRAF